MAALVAAPVNEAGAPVRLKLRFSTKLGYSAGQLIEGVINNALSVFLLFYLTAVCGLTGGLAGAALSIGIVIDAVMDPLIGTITDGWRSRWGRRLPFMLAGLAPIAVTFVLLFSLPTWLSQLQLFAWVTLLSVVLRISMSLFILPYQAVGAELSDDYAERSGVMAWRWGIGMIGGLVGVVLGFGVFFAGAGGLTRRAAYMPFALSLTAVLLIGGLLASRTVWIERIRLHAPPSSAAGVHSRFVGELLELFRNPSFRNLFGGALLFFIALGVNASLGLHANTFFWQLTSGQTQTVTLGLFGGLLAGAPLAGPFLMRMEKRTVLGGGMLGMLLAQGGPVTLRLLGALPLQGHELTILLTSLNFAGGVVMAAAAIAFSSMMADAADEHEHLFHARREGLFFAGWAFASKAATGAGALIAGLVLQFIDFPTDLVKHGGMTAKLPEHMVDMLALFYGPGAALLTFGAVIVNSFYRLDRRCHAAIIADLDERRRATANAASLIP